MGKEKVRVAAGADSRHGNVFLLDSCFQENNAVGLPEIQLILSIVFFVKKTIPVFFIKSILKLKDHIFAYFIAVLADGRADGGKKFCGIGAEFLVHFLYGYFSDFAHGSAPAGMGQANGMMNRVYEIQGHTVCIVGGQHHTRDVGDHSICIMEGSRTGDAVSSVFCPYQAHIRGVSLIR